MGEKTKHQRFDVEVVHRSKLLNAPYNPRTISEEAMKRLRNGIAKRGLVEPVIWNRRTGHIVGGHQRIAALDALEKTHRHPSGRMESWTRG